MNPVGDTFWRHVAACNNLGTAAARQPFRIGAEAVGRLSPAIVEALAGWPGCRADAAGVTLAGDLRTVPRRTAALAAAAEHLAARGLLRRRGEAFDVRATAAGPVLATLDRGALPAFGILSQGVHVNGLVRCPGGHLDALRLWVGWRARDKAVAPGQLDNLVAGGIPAGLSAAATLVKEAAEEASLPADLARRARPVGRVSYAMAEAAGTRRDVLHCFDLDVPEDFVPVPNDDEVERFELWPAARVLEAVRDTGTVKFNVNLVLIDLFLRHRLIDPDGEAGRRLRAGLEQGVLDRGP